MFTVVTVLAAAIASGQVAPPATSDRAPAPGAAAAASQPPAAAAGPTVATAGAAQQAAAIERGTATYRSTCGFCHGINAAGGSSGPTLLTSNYVLPGGAALLDMLRNGRPANGMPAFPTLTAEEVSDIAAFLVSRAKGATPPRPAINPAEILVGDAAAGRRFFEGQGQCTRCHSATGDLQAIGSRYNPMVLQARIVNPRLIIGGARPAPPSRVTVTLPDGAVVSGVLREVSDFHVTLTDAGGARRTFLRDNEVPRVVVEDPVDYHRQMLLKWKDRDMHDLTAYLATLK